MPALPRFRIEALAQLSRELRFESPGAARRQLERAEALALEVLADRTPSRAYPLDYIRFRITGLASEPGGEIAEGRAPVVLVREALLADLGVLVERLSVAAAMTAGELRTDTGAPEAAEGKERPGRPARGTRVRRGEPAAPALRGPWLDARELAARWSVGMKTLERLRRRGLLARRALDADAGPKRGAAARQRLFFAATAVEACERAGIVTLAVRDAAPVRAARTPRLTEQERRLIVRRAARYRARFGWTLNQCATRIAPTLRCGAGGGTRSVEMVRRALRQHDQASTEPMFTERGPLSEHERSLVERSRRAGGSPGAMAKKLKRSAASIHRVSLERRAARLRELDLSGPRGPLFELAQAAEVHLAPAAVRAGLGAGPPRSVPELVSACDAMEPPGAAQESARAVAYWFLRHRAGAATARLPRHGARAADLDAIETDLRWASRLKAELVRSQLPTALRSIRARLGGGDDAAVLSLPARGPGGAAALFHGCIGALIESVDRFDPFKALTGGGRLAAPAAMSVNRVLTRWAASRAAPADVAARSAQRIDSTPMEDWTLRVDPWQAWLEPSPGVVATLRADAEIGRLPDMRAKRLLRMRLGLEGGPPRTSVDVARAMRMTVTRVSAIERQALAALSEAHGATVSPARGGRPRRG